MSDYEFFSVADTAAIIEHSIGLLRDNKPLLATRLLEQLHERLAQDDGMHHKACTAEVCGEHFVAQ